MTEETVLHERELVERARQDVNAFSELYRLYLPRIHAFALRRTGSRADAEDICSATFEKALRSLDKFRWGPDGFAPWLFRIASNEVITHYRRSGRSESPRGQGALAALHSPDTEDSYRFNDDDAELCRHLNDLNPRYQQAVALRYLADLDHGEAAAAMGMPNAAYAVVLSRALKALRKKLA